MNPTAEGLMGIDVVDWDDPDDPAGNVRHVAEHGLSPEEVEDVLDDPAALDGTSRRSGRPTKTGWTSTGRHIRVVFVVLESDPMIVRPITAFDVPEP